MMMYMGKYLSSAQHDQRGHWPSCFIDLRKTVKLTSISILVVLGQLLLATRVVISSRGARRPAAEAKGCGHPTAGLVAVPTRTLVPFLCSLRRRMTLEQGSEWWILHFFFNWRGKINLAQWWIYTFAACKLLTFCRPYRPLQFTCHLFSIRQNKILILCRL